VSVITIKTEDKDIAKTCNIIPTILFFIP